MIPLAAVLFALLGKSLGQCPHDDPGLERWSDASTWPGATVSTGNPVADPEGAPHPPSSF